MLEIYNYTTLIDEELLLFIISKNEKILQKE